MKKLYTTILLMVSCVVVFAQQTVSGLFTPKQNFQQSVSRAVSAYSAFDINYTVLSSLYNARPQSFQLQLPFEGQLITIDFQQTKITTDNFSVITSDDDKDVSLARKANIELGV